MRKIAISLYQEDERKITLWLYLTSSRVDISRQTKPQNVQKLLWEHVRVNKYVILGGI